MHIAHNARVGMLTSRQLKRKAFTLIELLTVMGIVALLVSMILGAGVLARIAAQRARAKADIQKIHGALQEYKLQYKKFDPTSPSWAGYPYPTALSGTAVTNWLPQNFTFRDPWQNPYQYSYTPGAEVYDLYSKGKHDKPNETEDDIRSSR